LLVLLVLASGGTVLLAIAYIDWRMDRLARPRIIHNIDNVPETTVALVLGARVYPSGRLSAMLEDRVRSAVDLYHAGKVKKLLMSGDNSERTYDEVTAMRKFAIGLGVPSDDVVRDFAGFRTYDSLYRAKELWDIDRAIIVTQRFHLPRAIYIARRLGIDAWGYVADRREYAESSARRVRLREVLGRALAFLDIKILKPKPYFLGPKESLSGDSQVETAGTGD
jgi:SanA protein